MNKSLNFVLHKKNISLKKYNNFKIEAKALNFYIPENINGFINLLKYFNDIKKKIYYFRRRKQYIICRRNYRNSNNIHGIF